MDRNYIAGELVTAAKELTGGKVNGKVLNGELDKLGNQLNNIGGILVRGGGNKEISKSLRVVGDAIAKAKKTISKLTE